MVQLCQNSFLIIEGFPILRKGSQALIGCSQESAWFGAIDEV